MLGFNTSAGGSEMMDAATITRRPSVRWPGASLTASLGQRLRQMSGPQRGVVISVLTAAVLAPVVVTQGPQVTGYLTVFGLSILFNALLFVPVDRGAVMLAGAMVLDPLAVAILSGVGGALGELTGCVLGRSSNNLIKTGKLASRVQGVAERRMALSILVLSTIPNPFVDFIGIIAGRIRYPVALFLTYSIIGKVAQCVAIVYMALWNMSLFGSWLGIG